MCWAVRTHILKTVYEYHNCIQRSRKVCRVLASSLPIPLTTSSWRDPICGCDSRLQRQRHLADPWMGGWSHDFGLPWFALVESGSLFSQWDSFSWPKTWTEASVLPFGYGWTQGGAGLLQPGHPLGSAESWLCSYRAGPGNKEEEGSPSFCCWSPDQHIWHCLGTFSYIRQ